jgi:formamidopyrimidine-DNA glycosylase
VIRRYLDATSLHKTINRVELRCEQLIQGVTSREFREALAGQSFVSTRRHGKWLFAELDSHILLILHFGMTGRLVYFRDLEKDPDHDRMLLAFDNGYQLAYDSVRRLGSISLTESVGQWLEEKDLGPDALNSSLSTDGFRRLLTGRRGMIKPALMNQKIIAGIGNAYSDEILFQAGIHPRTSASELDEDRLDELHATMKEVLQVAIDHQADPARLPDDFILKHRRKDGHCPVCGTDLMRVKVSGRTAYICPNRQPDPE